MSSTDWFSAPFTATARCSCGNSTATGRCIRSRASAASSASVTDRWKCDDDAARAGSDGGCSRAPAAPTSRHPVAAAAGGARSCGENARRRPSATARSALPSAGGGARIQRPSARLAAPLLDHVRRGNDLPPTDGRRDAMRRCGAGQRERTRRADPPCCRGGASVDDSSSCSAQSGGGGARRALDLQLRVVQRATAIRLARRVAQPHVAPHGAVDTDAVRRPRHLARRPRAQGHAGGAAAKGERGADAPAGDCRGGGGGADARRRRVRRAALWRAPPVLTGF